MDYACANSGDEVVISRLVLVDVLVIFSHMSTTTDHAAFSRTDMKRSVDWE